MNGGTKTNKILLNTLNGVFGGVVQNPPTQMKVGIGTTTALTSDTDLANPIPVRATEQIDTCDATTGWTALGDSVVSLNTTTFKQGTGALNLYKTGATVQYAEVEKTVTSLNFTSKTFWVWVYVRDKALLDSGGINILIKYGSDNANYYEYDVYDTSLIAGWNAIKFTSATATSTVGAPVIAACDYLRMDFVVPLTTSLLAAGDIIIDDPKLASSDDYYTALTASYPYIDTTKLTAETRISLTTLEANGYAITETGEFDASGNLLSRNVFDPESKSSTDLFIIIEKTYVRTI